MKNTSARSARQLETKAPLTGAASDSGGPRGTRRFVFVLALVSTTIGAGVAWHFHSKDVLAPPLADVAPVEDSVMTSSSGRPLDDAFKQAVQADVRRTQTPAAR